MSDASELTVHNLDHACFSHEEISFGVSIYVVRVVTWRFSHHEFDNICRSSEANAYKKVFQNTQIAFVFNEIKASKFHNEEGQLCFSRIAEKLSVNHFDF